MKKMKVILLVLLFFMFTFVQKTYSEKQESDIDNINNFGYVVTDLENEMTPSEDLPSNMTIDEYLAQYTYPHLPKGGVTDNYKSTEVDIRKVDKSKIALVRNLADWNKAIYDANIEVISIMNSFAMDGVMLSSSANDRKLTIEGNNMLVDFRTGLSQLGGARNNVTIQNLNAYHGNYYGFLRPYATTSMLSFHNLNDYGSQIISSQCLPVQISGDFTNRFTNNGGYNKSYISPIDGKTSVVGQTVGQQNFESSDLNFFAGAQVVLQTGNGINIDLTGSGNITFNEDVKVDIIAANSSEASGEGYQGYAISTRYASKFIMKKNSEINYTYKDPGNGTRDYAGLLWFQSTGSSFSMADGAKLTVNKDSHSGNNGIIHFNGFGTFLMDQKSEINMNINDKSNGATAISLQANNSTFDVKNGSKINTNFTSTGTGNNPIIKLGAGASLNIGKDSDLSIKTNGYHNSILTMGNGSSSNPTNFSVGENAIFNVESTNRNTWNNNVVDVGNYADFKIDRLGTFILSADKAKYLFHVGTNSNFAFSDAKLVEFGFTNTPDNNSSLIYMNGDFTVDVQRVLAWNRSAQPLDVDNPSYDWNPMFGMRIPYQGTAVNKSNIRGASTTPGTGESFKQNYNTGAPDGFQKLRFEFIPDVSVSIDEQPVDNPDSPNSKIITGTASEGAFIRLSQTIVPGGYDSFPKSNNKIPNPSINLDGSQGEPYTTVADEYGHFTFEVPTENEVPFVAGSKIEAYAFLNGKSDTTDIIVKDTTPPTAEPYDYLEEKGSDVPKPSVFVQNPKDSNPAPQNFTYEYKTDINDVTAMMSVVGTHKIEVYVFDNAGNKCLVESNLIIFETDKRNVLEASDISITQNELKLLENLEEYILKESGAEAYKIVDNRKVDFTDKIKVTDYDGLTTSTKKGVFNVTLSVPNEPLIKTIKFTVIPSEVEMTLKQVYRGTDDVIYSDLKNKTPISNYKENVTIGDSITGIVDRLISDKKLVVNHEGFVDIDKSKFIIKVNGIEKEVTEVPDTNFELIYEYEGQMFFETVPDLRFGQISTTKNQSVHKLADTEIANVEIINTLQLKNWELKVSLPKGIKKDGVSTGEEYLGELIYYGADNSKTTIGIGGTKILTQSNPAELFSELDMKGKNDVGMRLTQNIGNSAGNYQGDLLWSLDDVPK